MIDVALVVRGESISLDGDRGLRRDAAVVFETRAQIRAADQLHDEGEVVAVHDEIADADHARMVQAEQGAALLHEALHQIPVRGEVLAQDLDRDGALGAFA